MGAAEEVDGRWMEVDGMARQAQAGGEDVTVHVAGVTVFLPRPPRQRRVNHTHGHASVRAGGEPAAAGARARPGRRDGAAQRAQRRRVLANPTCAAGGTNRGRRARATASPQRGERAVRVRGERGVHGACHGTERARAAAGDYDAAARAHS